jgi:hypothetical protein
MPYTFGSGKFNQEVFLWSEFSKRPEIQLISVKPSEDLCSHMQMHKHA